ncbi:hypothetical protein G7Y79_00030g064180 [Physcia stellaris]|nr:hypothetical protein G7Y79_00030g064180 [Physcia stellaris]
MSTFQDADSITRFPVELVTVVFCHLPSFQDVFSLASTCHRVRDVWLENLATIYKCVARASITCEHHARILLADQGGPAPDSEITSVRHVSQMLKNQNAIFKAIREFESQIVSRVKARGHRTEDYYGPGAQRHPPYLTRTERPRFIRSYYHLWGLLMIKDPVKRQARMHSMSLKQLLYLCEISWLPDGMGPGEEVTSSTRDRAVDPESKTEAYQERIQAREALSKEILELTKLTYQHIHGQDMELIWVIAMDEGYSDFLVMWDHWRSSLQDVVCGRRSKEPPYKKYFHWELWEESSDEEV